MSTHETEVVAEIGSDYEEKYGFHDPESYVFKSKRGLSAETVEEISAHKNEPDWMRRYRLRSLEYFRARPLPGWGGDLSGIDFENIFYYLKPTESQAQSWEDLPPDIKNTWDRLGIPEAERKYLAGPHPDGPLLTQAPSRTLLVGWRVLSLGVERCPW